MTHADFVHLRVHSAYSLSEGAIHVKDLATLCREMSMPAVAVTDTNNLFGALEFSEAAAKSGIQPIIGCQLRVQSTADGAPTSRPGDGPKISGDMVFLAKDDAGYRNLLKLLAYAYLETDDADEPHITLDVMATYADGLITLTGGALGPLGKILAAGQMPLAESFLDSLQAAFGDRLYMEVQRHGTLEERATEEMFLELAYARDIPLVATNEAYFSERDMYEAHDALLCIADGAYVSQRDRLNKTPEHYLKTAQEMRALFVDLPEAVDNTLVIAQRCAFMVEHIDPILPPYNCGEGRTEEDELRAQSVEGLNERLEQHVYQEGMDEAARTKAAVPYRERLNYELGVINQMGFPGYFLIVADFIQWAKDRNIPVGPGRGSGAGSVVAWGLNITDLDPLRFGLLFERFLNPERVSMPDFDVDFCQDRRDEVIRYVQEKYGRDHVAQIITFGKLQARAVLRDVGRVLEMPYGYIDKICKMVPNNPANPVSLPEAIASEPQLRELINEDPDVRRLTDMAKKLEGLYRHASTHAAGVVIGDRPLDKLIPLYRDPRSDMMVTGFNMKFVESAGLVKFDFLGLKTLTVLVTAEKLVREKGGNIDLAKLPLDNRATFDMISRGETAGVFQLESSGMVDVLKGMQPDTFEDIIAVVALYRPGPMDNIPSYIRRKHGKEKIDYLYPNLEPILKETFGIMIYQEQVMQIAQELSGYTLGGADLLRRAMGKKIQAEMDQQRQIFIKGAVEKGVPEKKASDIFDQVNKFAGYGFNKSHAAAYALVAYQTAYMKANHPVEFMAASMTLDINNTEKLNFFRQELQRLKIPVLPPDVNASDVVFTLESKDEEPAIRYALAAVKNVGGVAMATMVAEREANGPYADLSDFFSRLDTHSVNRRQLENLTRAGGLDCLDRNRQKVFTGIETLMRHAVAAQNDRDSNQIGLFADGPETTMAVNIPDMPDWPIMERLNEEFEALGCYLSGHPLDTYGSHLKQLGVETIVQAMARKEAAPVNLAGTVVAKKERTSAKGNRYAFVGLSDSSGAFEVTVFSEALAAAREFLEVGRSVFIKATVQPDDGGVRFLANEFLPLEAAAARAVEHLRICIASDDAVPAIRDILAAEKIGHGRVRIHAQPTDCHWEADLELDQGFNLSPDAHLALRNLPDVIRVETFDMR
ncbi:MAG: DNA polymerase III subunit alpha [Alphaproteobacteria bacterium]|nr:DNA polymerase III subunit alpha [Alphaproteobacteria bacterium]